MKEFTRRKEQCGHRDHRPEERTGRRCIHVYHLKAVCKEVALLQWKYVWGQEETKINLRVVSPWGLIPDPINQAATDSPYSLIGQAGASEEGEILPLFLLGITRYGLFPAPYSPPPQVIWSYFMENQA